jgi:hypothetical protein
MRDIYVINSLEALMITFSKGNIVEEIVKLSLDD